MKFIHVFITVGIIGYILFISFLTLGALYIEFLMPNPDTMDLLFVLLAEMYIIPFIMLILLILLFLYYQKLQVLRILCAGIISIWLTELIKFISEILTFWFNIEIYYLVEYSGVLNLVLFIIAFLVLKKQNSWLNTNGFVIGVIIGFILSYGGIILARWFTNTLMSLFWFDDKETASMLIIILLGGITGNYLGKKMKKTRG